MRSMKRSDLARRTVVFGVTIDYQLRYHEGLYERLVDDGWDVHVVSSPGPRLTRAGELKGVTAHSLVTNRQPSPTADLRSLMAWYRVLRGIRPGVVVIGTPKAGLLGLVAALVARVPHRVYELHGLRFETAHGPSRWLLLAMEWVACTAATQVVAVGESVQSRATGARLVPRRKVRVLGAGSPNGVDIMHFKEARKDEAARRMLRAQLGIGESQSVVVFVGRLTRDKGLETLARALKRVSRVRRDVCALLVGGIDDSSGEVGLSHLREAVSSCVHVGEVADPAPYLAIADVMCLPSYREGLPTVVLEAFAAGVPVVATAATGIVDLVTAGVTGRLAPIDDDVALAAAITELLDDPAEAAMLARSGGELVATEFAAATVQRRWAAYLNSLAR